MGEVAGSRQDFTGKEGGRSNLARWLRLSVVLNLVLAGAFVGCLVAGLSGGTPAFLLPPPMPGGHIQSLFQEVIEETLQGTKKDEALSVVARHTQRFEETLESTVGEAALKSFDRERMSRFFVEGEVTEELLERWLATRKAAGEAHLRLISGIFLDLSKLLDRGERERLAKAIRQKMPERRKRFSGSSS